MRDSISALRDIFRACPLLQEKDAERERLHGFSKSDRHRTAEDSDQAFLPLFYDIPIRVYGLRLSKNTGIDLAYHQAQKKIGTEVEIYIDPSDPEKYFCPADVKMYRMTQICLLCCGWLFIVGTPIFCFILEYLY